MKKWLLLIPLLILFSCKKAEDRECAKAAGKQTSLTIPLPSFNKLHIGSKIEVILIQDVENKIVIHGRDNLIKHISYNIDDEGFLKLENKNRCDFLRSYEKNKIKIEVHFVDLNKLLFEGTFDLTTRNIINTDVFDLIIQDGGATVYLNLNCHTVFIHQGHGYGDTVLSGFCQKAHLRITSNGFAKTTNLTVADELFFISSTPVSSSINVEGAKTTVEINGSGNVIYTGQPLSINYIQHGTGELINGN